MVLILSGLSTLSNAFTRCSESCSHSIRSQNDIMETVYPLFSRHLCWRVSQALALPLMDDLMTFDFSFSSAKRCSNEGRALMQLDYRQFVVKLEKMCDMKPLPHQDYVTQYIKAFYIPEMDLEAWVQQHSEVRVDPDWCNHDLTLVAFFQEYTDKQLVALVDSVAYSNNKTKQKLNNLISDLSGRIRR